MNIALAKDQYSEDQSPRHSHYAYGEERAGVEAVMRFHAVTRWHMISTSREQSLAEHSANVALLAYYIVKSAPEMFFGSACSVAGMALLHDVAEVFVGDIPSHTKRRLSGIDELERATTPGVFVEDMDWNTTLLVKLCDIADGIRFIRLHGVDITARHAKEGLEAQLAARLDEARDFWPTSVLRHVRDAVFFYAYEQS